MENNIYCGICGEEMTFSKDGCFFMCRGCNIKRNGKFLEKFMEEKYKEKIKKIEITGINSAKIYFTDKKGCKKVQTTKEIKH